MDLATILGIIIALGSVLGGFILEGGHLKSVSQLTAGIIVVGGMIGAIFVQFPMAHLKKTVGSIKILFLPGHTDMVGLVRELVDYAQKARREGIVSLETDVDKVADPFLKKAMRLAVDGTESRVVREAMEVELTIAEEEGEAPCKVFEAGGGYAPTVGILGAVLGLIHVMENLAEPDKLGAGIATAFVATVYGVAVANLFMLPMAGKLKTRHKHAMMKYELIITAVTAIIDGENPRLIEQKLYGFCGEEGQVAAEQGNMKKAA